MGSYAASKVIVQIVFDYVYTAQLSFQETFGQLLVQNLEEDDNRGVLSCPNHSFKGMNPSIICLYEIDASSSDEYIASTSCSCPLIR